MRIAIDLQGAQAANARRGIGTYSLALAEHLARAPRDHELVFVLNGAFPDETDDLRCRFDAGHVRTEVWFPPESLRGAVEDDRWTRRAAEVIREEFVASLDPDLVLTTSLFEGFNDPAVTSVRSDGRAPSACVLYDLIPLVRRDDYLSDDRMARWYEDRLRHLRRADHLLAISSSTRLEAIEWLGGDDGWITDIGAAADDRFQPGVPPTDILRALQQRVGLSRPHLIYTGGIDPRKNIDRLVLAYGRLPLDLRRSHQLAIVCSIQPSERDRLDLVRRRAGLDPDELVVTGFVSADELVALTQTATAAVFPSLHEGFGLPVLEAMKCGTAVVASDRSSLPEVVGRPDALFDPTSVESIATKLAQVLGDAPYREDLRRHALVQSAAYSWQGTADRALDALEALHRDATRRPAPPGPRRLGRERPRLAMLTPLPPAASGISDYSALLLPELSRHYDVEIVTDDAVSAPVVHANSVIRSVEWFRANHRAYDRIVYHLGNSEFHGHMFDLLEAIPGVVVLHDFALSGIVSHLDARGLASEPWRTQLYRSHGYRALLDDVSSPSRSDMVWQYPVSLAPLQHALGVLVHSKVACRLAADWYGPDASTSWQVIPMPRRTTGQPARADARSELGIGPEEILVCAFGMVGPTKMSDRLAASWGGSSLADDPLARLVFVGEQGDARFSELLDETIQRSGATNVVITGRVTEDEYARYLAAADIGVQLRTRSRGETSASAYDCLAAGMATIVNANGALTELPSEAVIRLDDDFANDELARSLDALAHDARRRTELGDAGRSHVRQFHSPRQVADAMAHAIETIWARPTNRRRSLPSMLRELPIEPTTSGGPGEVARSATLSLRASPAPRQLLVDVSELSVRDVGSGIQRVTRNLVRQLLLNPPVGFRVEPVAAEMHAGYRYARRFTCDLLGVDADLHDDAIDVTASDVFLGLDLLPQVVPAHRAHFRQMRQRGAHLAFVVYDLLPINAPEFFVPGAAELYGRWMQTVSESHSLISISRSVMEEVRSWLADHPRATPDPALAWFHLGGDLDAPDITDSQPPTGESRASADSPEFLMVGTIEPRKGHEQVLDAMELLWAEGDDVRLTVLGKHGWMMESFIRRMREHPELGRRLTFAESATDAELEAAYRRCDCLLQASHGEGFGLPLVEAARHDLAVLARDLPVFREVAGDRISYFSGTSAPELAAAIRRQVQLEGSGVTHRTRDIPVLSWAASCDQLLAALESSLDITFRAS